MSNQIELSVNARISEDQWFDFIMKSLYKLKHEPAVLSATI